MTVVRIVLTLCFRQFLYCEFELDNFNKICQICPNCKHRNINNRFHIGILTTDFRKVKRLSVHDAGQTEMSDPPNITVGRLVPKCNFGTPPVKKV